MPSSRPNLHVHVPLIFKERNQHVKFKTRSRPLLTYCFCWRVRRIFKHLIFHRIFIVQPSTYIFIHTVHIRTTHRHHCNITKPSRCSHQYEDTIPDSAQGAQPLDIATTRKIPRVPPQHPSTAIPDLPFTKPIQTVPSTRNPTIYRLRPPSILDHRLRHMLRETLRKTCTWNPSHTTLNMTYLSISLTRKLRPTSGHLQLQTSQNSFLHQNAYSSATMTLRMMEIWTCELILRIHMGKGNRLFSSFTCGCMT